jgi:pyrimidine operon attenuation protein/uracil phosphoribosyltransferase
MSVILNSGEISRALRRISHEILEKNHGSSDLLLLGIPTRGALLRKRQSLKAHWTSPCTVMIFDYGHLGR